MIRANSALAILLCALVLVGADAFSIPGRSVILMNNNNNNEINQQPANVLSNSSNSCRRTFFANSLMKAFVGLSPIFVPAIVHAIPMVSTTEFETILRDSARSVQRVEFSGPKNELVTVKLVDGTAFGIKDVVESPTDPRSPLKIAAICRENGVPTKFLEYEAILANTPKRKKMYANARVQEAAAKERERLARMEQDEADRLAALYKMEEQTAASSASTPATPTSK